jgi:titin
MVSLVVFMGLLGFITFETEEASAQVTLYVGGAGFGNYSKIQDAINASIDGDTVYVYNGTYYENIEVNRTINLTGEHMSNTTIDGQGAGDVVLVVSSWVNITGFTITNGTVGIHVSSISDNSISDNNASNNGIGIKLSSAPNNNITNNSVSYCVSDGIFLESSWGNNIICNNASNNSHSGIYLTASDGNYIIGNNASGNADSGINLTTSDSNDIMDNDVHLNDHCGIELDTSNYNTISNNTIWNILPIWQSGRNGIILESSDHNTISGNNVSYHEFGIILDVGSSYNDIIDNEIFWNGEGIWLGDNCDYNNLTDNTVLYGFADCIYLQRASYNKITGNYISLGNQGIWLMSASQHNTVSYNEVVSTGAGILTYESSNNDIEHNNLTRTGISITGSSNINVQYNNITGRPFGYGIRISSSNFPASQNQIRNNNITDHGQGILVMGFGMNAPNNNWIVNNRITNCTYGMEFWGMSFGSPFNNYVIDNTLLDNEIGIYMWTTRSNTLINNTMISCGIVIQGDGLDYWNTHVITTNNTVNGKPVYYWKDQVGGTIPAGAGEVILVSCDDTMILNQELTLGSVGIELGYTSGIKIDKVNVSGNSWHGMYIHESTATNITNSKVASNGEFGVWIYTGNGKNLIQNTTFMNHTFDINLYAADENEIVDNIVNNSGGFRISSSDRNHIMNNNISHSNYGLYLQGSHENNITGNNISHNEMGIYMLNSNENKIIQNQVYNNSIYGFNLSNSQNNVIYHNNIIGNGNQSIDDGNSTLWNSSYPTGGNYWSDYCPGAPDLYNGSVTPQTTGVPDGICDNQYDIDGDSMDYYPLKKPWDPASSSPSSPLSLVATAEVHVVNLSWNDPADDGGFPVMKYIIYRGDFLGGETYLTEVTGDMYYNDTTVTNWATYYYLVSAVNILGEGILSNGDSAMPFSEPMQPTNLTDIWGDSYVNLTWNATADDGGFPVTLYNIYRNGTLIGTTPDNQLWYNDTGATNGITYSYNVSANNSIGESSLSIGLDSSPMTKPLTPVITDIAFGDSYLELFWDPPLDNGGSPITFYYIYKNGPVFASVPGTQTSFMDTNVNNGITYTYNVSAINIIGESPLSLGMSGTPMKVPSEPLDLQFQEGDGYINLTWIVPADDGGSPITEYFIYRNGIVIGTVSSTQFWYNDASAVNGIGYTYNISANNSVGEGSKSSGVIATPKARPSAPQNIQADSGDEYVRLTWEAPVSDGGFSITEYFIYRDGSLYDSVFGTLLWFNDTNVTNGVTYNYNISANNSVGEGQLSMGVQETPMTQPSVPQNFQAEPERGYVYLFWNTSLDNGGSFISEYFIYRNGTLLNTTSQSQLWYNDTDVMIGVTYTYSVSAGNSVGPGPLTGSVDAKPFGISTSPQNIHAEAGDGYVKISWEAPTLDGGSTISNYTIYRGTTTGGETFLAEIGVVFYFNDTDVINGQTYYYRVSAINSVGEGALSVEVNGTPDNQPPTCSITTPTSEQMISGTFRVTGTATDSDGTIKLVEIRWGEGSWVMVNGTTSWTYDTNTTQAKNGEYMLYVRSYDGTNYSEVKSVSVIINNPTEKESGEEMPWLWILLIIIVVIALIIFLIFSKKRRKEEEIPEEPSEEEQPKEEEEDIGDEEEPEEEEPSEEPSEMDPPPPPPPSPKEPIWEETSEIEEEEPKEELDDLN